MECGLSSQCCWKIIVTIVLSAIVATISSLDRTSKLRSNTSITLHDNSDRCKQIDTSASYPYAASFPSHNMSYIPLGGYRFEEYKCGDTPYNITSKDKQNSDEVANVRRMQVKNAMQYAWRNYKEHAFGMDELQPTSGRGNEKWGGMAVTMIDALDTLWIMNLKDEFYEARNWIKDNLTFDSIGDVSNFETTIRSLGGLSSAYDLSKDPILLEKAQDLGKRLIKSFNTQNGLPYGVINLQTGKGHNFRRNGYDYLLAEVGTNQLEYWYLSSATGDQSFVNKSIHVFDIIQQIMPSDGLLPLKLKDGINGIEFSTDHISFGGMGDSAYEYMLKLWLRGGKKEHRYRDMWDASVQGLHDHLLQQSSPNGLTYIAERKKGKLVHRFEHLTCFMGGSLALTSYTDPSPNGLESPRARRDLKTAKSLAYTCYQMYARTKSGLSPEYVLFTGEHDDYRIPHGGARQYILRPEVIESLYYLNKLTGDPIYREWGWEIFQSLEKYCKSRYGYASLKDVNRPNKKMDKMESFFLAETLKYMYLLFDTGSTIDILHTHVFNTEAHPLPMFG